MRTCTKCGAEKHESEFFHTTYVRQDGTRGYRGDCKECCAKTQKAYYDKDPERVLRRNKIWAMKESSRYSNALSGSRYQARVGGHTACNAAVEDLKLAFTGTCYICDVPEVELDGKLQMDHDHSTGDFRGWLCPRCNLMVGFSGDSTDVMLRGVAYLEAVSRKQIFG